MSLFFLDESLWFPPVEEAEEDGLLAIGGDLGAERLLLAYRSGIFPWYSEDEPPMWWCPNPRFVLFPHELKVSKSMKQVLKSGAFEFTFNTAFDDVIKNCMKAPRPGQGGTWISNDIVAAYTRLHRLGYAVSAEAWCNGELVGGLYGIKIGDAFFGESMFAKMSNASKFAFINCVGLLEQDGIGLIDCQVYTPHLESLGARMIDRALFLKLIKRLMHISE